MRVTERWRVGSQCSGSVELDRVEKLLSNRRAREARDRQSPSSSHTSCAVPITAPQSVSAPHSALSGPLPVSPHSIAYSSDEQQRVAVLPTASRTALAFAHALAPARPDPDSDLVFRVWVRVWAADRLAVIWSAIPGRERAPASYDRPGVSNPELDTATQRSCKR